MKISKKLLILALLFSSFFPLAASIRTLDFQQKPHIGHFSDFSPDAHPVTVVYLLETQQGTQLVWCTMHIDPTDNMVNGYSGGMSWSGGMERYVGDLIENYSVDSFGKKIVVKFEGSKSIPEQRTYKVLKLLHPSIKGEKSTKNKEWYCVKLPEKAKSTSVSQKLIKYLIDTYKGTIRINTDSGRRMFYRHTNKTVFFPKGIAAKSFFTKDFPKKGVIPKVFISTLGDNEKEQAVMLGHELIHAYYGLIGKARPRSNKENNEFLWMYDKDTTNKRIRFYNGHINNMDITLEEEFFTIGTIAVTKVNRKDKKITYTYYDADYTENKLAKALGLTEFRLTHIGPTRRTYAQFSIKDYTLTPTVLSR